MRIIVHDYAGHAFPAQLSRSLAARGHEVTHAYATFLQTPRGALIRRPGDPDTFSIEGISLSRPFPKHDFFRRRFREVEYGRNVARLVERLSPQWVISGQTPTEPQATFLRASHRAGAKFVTWIQDFYGIAVDRLIRQRAPILGAAVGEYYKWLDRQILRNSDRVVPITEDFRPLLERIRVTPERIHVIENWAPLQDLPLCPKPNRWSEEQGLSSKFTFMYSGTLGMKHNPALLLRLAERYRDDDNTRVVVISEGLGAQWLHEQRARNGLENLILLPFQPFDRLPELLGTADVLLSVLEPEAGVFSVPSKILSYLCAGKPLVAAMPGENLATRIIERSNSGSVVPPDDVGAFVAASEQLYTDAELRTEMGRNARYYAVNTFDIERITDAFEAVMK